MINKSKLWFLTLSSIILVLAVYYIAIPGNTASLVFSNVETKDNIPVSVEESEVLTAMRVTKDEEDFNKVQTLQEILLDSSKSVDEKNEAYEQIKYLNANKSLEEKLESEINNKYKINCFVSISESNIKVVIANMEKSAETANNIINHVNSATDSNYYVTVKFE